MVLAVWQWRSVKVGWFLDVEFCKPKSFDNYPLSLSLLLLRIYFGSVFTNLPLTMAIRCQFLRLTGSLTALRNVFDLQ